MNKWWVICALCASLLTSVVLYGNTIRGEFVFDDEYFTAWEELRTPQSLTNIWLKPLTNNRDFSLVETYRPFVVFTMALNFILFGEATTSFHVVNIILNGLVGFLVFYCVYLLFRKLVVAACTALLFMFFPIHTEAVAFIKAREEALGSGFMLLSWIAFLNATGKTHIRWRYVLLSVVFFFFGCLSKEFLLIFPIVYFGVYWLHKKPRIIVTVQLAVPFIIVGIIYVAMWYTSLGGKLPFENLHTYPVNPIAHVELPVRVWTACAIAFTYIWKTFVPIGLTATYRYNHFPLVERLFSYKSFAGLLFLICLGVPFVVKKFRTSALAVGALIFLVSYFPFSKFVFTGGEFMAERWMYFPSMGLALIAAVGIAGALRRYKIITMILFATVLVVYAITTVQRNRVWLSPESLYSSMTHDAPNSVFGYVWLSRYYLVARRFDDAKHNILRAVRIYPGHHQVQAAYAAVLAHDKQYERAERAIIRAINLKPETSSYYFWAYIMTKMGKYDESQQVIDAYLGPRRSLSEVKFLTAVNYFRMGQVEKAREYFDWNSKLSEEEKIRAINEF